MLRIDATTAAQHFNEMRQNIGVLVGDERGSADIDCDCDEAIVAARVLLPATRLIFGRASKARSHYFFRCVPPLRTQKYEWPPRSKRRETLIELRCLKVDGSIGLQTIVPPSVHEGTGELVCFEPECCGPPSSVDGNILARAVGKVAAAALLAKHWPAHGRHNAEMALAGVLVRQNWPEEEATQFLLATYTAVKSHDPSKLNRVRQAVRDTFAKMASGEPATGYPTLEEHVGDLVAQTAFKWLGLIDEPYPSLEASGAHREKRTEAKDQYTFECGEGGIYAIDTHSGLARKIGPPLWVDACRR
jgi:hypothetical protein